ncbi:MAG: hypothetical protein K9G76_04910 [Bacteroidales bacterium]|nr:hypothetical protein [Bacteroidales bacterium]MCF8403019.1 hypothetical protein [Bacteroidales bacterium]
MKKIKIKSIIQTTVVILMLVSYSCIAQKHGNTLIGEIENDVPVITMDSKILKAKWEAILNEGGSEMNISEVEIVESRDGTYLLMCSNSDNSISACIALVLIDNEFYEQLTEEGGGLTVSCSGCALGCHPTIVNGKGYCEPLCTPCSKTETLASGGIM